MYDITQLKELKNPTVGEIMNILAQYPKDATVVCDGDEYFYIHVESDRSVINIDSSSLDDEYDEDDDEDEDEDEDGATKTADPLISGPDQHDVDPHVSAMMEARLKSLGLRLEMRSEESTVS